MSDYPQIHETIRVYVNLAPYLHEKLRELAVAQTGGDVHEMLRLIVKKTLTPEDLGIEVLDTMLRAEEEDT